MVGLENIIKGLGSHVPSNNPYSTTVDSGKGKENRLQIWVSPVPPASSPGPSEAAEGWVVTVWLIVTFRVLVCHLL